MPKNSSLTLKAVKAVVTLEQVLQHYGLQEELERTGDSLSGSHKPKEL